jgi:hypothetical protein
MGRIEKSIQNFWLENLKVGELGDQDMSRKVILK